MKRLLSLSLAVILILASLSGCGSTDSQTDSAADFTVTDMAGREVTIPAEINSIATFGAVGVLNAFVELMGSGDLICNQMPARFTKSDKWKMQYEFAPQIKDAPLLEGSDNELLIEEVLKLQPDLCVTMTKETAEQLLDNGVTCIYLEWKELEDVKTAVELMGQVLKKEDVAADYLAYFDSMLKEASDLTANLADDDKKTVLYGNITNLTQPHIIAEWWIEASGGISVTNDGLTSGESREYTQEDLLLWNPDIMLVTDRNMIDELKDDMLYSDVTAVKTDSIYYIPTVAHVWGNRTVEQPLTIFWTLNKLYPKIVSDDMLAEKISYFYSHFFKYNLSSQQLSEIMDKSDLLLPDLSGHTLNIFCGAGMTKPFQEIADAFKSATNCETEITFANAAQIQTQINTAKEGDMFIAGSEAELRPVEEAVTQSIPLVKHIPVIAVQSGNPKGISSLSDLAKDNVEILIGDPTSTPIGKIAVQAFEDAGITDKANIIANTATAPPMVTALAAGEADAVIVWKENINTDSVEIVDAEDMKKYIKTIPAALLKYTDDETALDAFVSYLNTDQAEAIWIKYGYELI